MEEFLTLLKDKAWKTQGARFNAQRRMERYDFRSSLSVCLMTVIIIGTNLLPFQCKEISVTLISVITIFLSILILSISQFISAREFKVKAMRFHDCGRELGAFLDKLNIELEIGNTTKERAEELSKEYQIIISQYDLNHSISDYKSFLRSLPEGSHEKK